MKYGLLVIVLLSGCSSMPRGEWAYQGLHAIDVMQTLNGPARDDCYREGAMVTRRVIGANPSEADVLAWGAAMSVAHYGVSFFLEDRAPDWALLSWQIITSGNVVVTIGENYRVGTKPWGDNDHSKSRSCGYTK